MQSCHTKFSNMWLIEEMELQFYPTSIKVITGKLPLFHLKIIYHTKLNRVIMRRGDDRSNIDKRFEIAL